jgi:AcrR family transcriptional regulator
MMDNTKRDEILKACLAEFAEYGYEKANTNRICEQAGVSKGLIFHYFGSKQKLYMLAVEQCINDILRLFEGFSTAGLGFVEAALSYGQLKSEFFAKNPLHYKILTQAFYHTPDEMKAEFAQKYARLYAIGNEIYRGLLTKLELRSGVSPEKAMEVVTAVLSSLEAKYTPAMVQGAALSPELVSQIEKDYVELMDLVLYGIAADEKH